MQPITQTTRPSQATLDPAECWQAVIDRNTHYDGQFYFAVRTTGIYCKPSCAARQPKHENVEFFATIDAAEQAGYRACKRCHPRLAAPPEPQLALIEQVCALIATSETPLSLNQLADHFHLSPFHLQRTFKRIVGVSPKQYGAALRSDRLRQNLQNGENVTTALYAAGFESNGALYSRSQAELGMQPQTYRQKGATATITFTVAPCALGFLLVASTARGLCAVRLGDSAAELEATLRAEFGAASITRDDGLLHEIVQSLLDYLQGERPHLDLPLDVQATAFQRKVWAALQAIPYGQTQSYSEVAAQIGQPSAVRAVARACATNSVALVIPCHRVVGAKGALSGYRWGIERKRQLLKLEQEKAAA